ncbi:unnamed protein product, partial [marine sediment metagenome]
ELNASSYTMRTTGRSARKKIDTYQYIEQDIVSDVQESIGCTDAGFPYVSYEQVAEWIGDSSYLRNYPEWIKQSKINEEREKINEDLEYT